MALYKELEHGIDEAIGNSREKTEFINRFKKLIEDSIERNYDDKDIEDVIRLINIKL